MKRGPFQFQIIAKYAVLEPNGTFLVFGEDQHDALVIMGKHREKLKHSKVISLGQTKSKAPADKEKSLIQQAKLFHSFDAGDLLASFSILPSHLKSIRTTIKEHGSTHIEFNCDTASAKAFLFDIHSHNGNALWTSSFVATADGIELANFRGKPSSFSMKAASFLSLPTERNETYSINLYEDYAIFFSGNDGTTIYIRDQELRKPYTTFFSDRLHRPITLLFQHKS